MFGNDDPFGARARINVEDQLLRVKNMIPKHYHPEPPKGPGLLTRLWRKVRGFLYPN